MKTLPATFEKGGFYHREVWREGNLAIYRRHKAEAVHFELIIVRVAPERVFQGIVFPEGESYPSSEQWGVYGFTFPDFESAINKAKTLKP